MTMFRRLFALTILLSGCAGRVHDAPCPSTPPDTPATAKSETARAPSRPAARSSDVASVDAILGALYDSVSGPPGPRDWDRVRSLFAPGARVAPVEKRDAGAVANIMDLDAFIARSSRNTSNTGFYEREIARRTEAFNHVVHVFSTYEARHAPADPSPFRRGINSIQLLKDGDRYWVVSIYWDIEQDGAPIPPEYLPPR
jgi:hypothetical protein